MSNIAKSQTEVKSQKIVNNSSVAQLKNIGHFDSNKQGGHSVHHKQQESADANFRFDI